MSMQNQNLELRREERQNLKTKYKNQRLQEAIEIYLCECEKVYLSFPALYLHVKNKHKIKLTTKITEKICKMEEKNGKTYITYFLINQSEEQKESQNCNQSDQAKRFVTNSGIKTSKSQNDEKTYLKSENLLTDTQQPWEGNLNDIPNSWIKSVTEQFLGQMTYPNLQTYHFFCKILTHFLNYIQTCSRNSKQFEQVKIYQPQTLVNLIPMYFNEFLCFYIPRFGGAEMQRPDQKNNKIQVLKCFGNWLRQKRYTTYLTMTGM